MRGCNAVRTQWLHWTFRALAKTSGCIARPLNRDAGPIIAVPIVAATLAHAIVTSVHLFRDEVTEPDGSGHIFKCKIYKQL